MSDAFLVLMLVSVGALLLGFVRPSAVLPGAMKPTRLRVLAVYLVAAVAFFIAFGVTHDREVTAIPASEAPKAAEVLTPAPAAPADPVARLEEALMRSDKSIEAHVAKTPEGTYRINTGYRPTSTWSESSFVTTAAMALRTIGSLAKESGLPIEEIQFHAFAPSVDAYGNSGVSKVFVFTLTRPDLDRINWKGIDKHQLLNLVHVELPPLGRKVILEYCSDQDNLKGAPNLCRRAATGR